MGNLDTNQIVRVFYKFSHLPSLVNQFDVDLGLSIVTMNYTKDRREDVTAGPWFISKFNAGLRLIVTKKGNQMPAASGAKLSNAVVEWSDSD